MKKRYWLSRDVGQWGMATGCYNLWDSDPNYRDEGYWPRAGCESIAAWDAPIFHRLHPRLKLRKGQKVPVEFRENELVRVDR